MLTTAQAAQAIANNLTPLGAESVTLSAASGRVLRQQAVAERDQPPFDRVMMDGIAIDHATFAAGCRRFRLAASQAAGDAVATIEHAEDCIEIMTGAVLPRGANCIIPVEKISVEEGFASIETGYEARKQQFIHPQGSDYTRGTVVLHPGIRIRPTDVAVLASCGLATVNVSTQPSIRIISTGNELVAAGQPIEDHQVRLSNGPALRAMLEQHGFRDCRHDHLPDEITVLQDRLAMHLAESDILVLSGGVSMGKADFVPQVLRDLGVRQVFHRISQRPGKPMWYGVGKQGQSIFALPGNPVSSLVCCRHYVVPALQIASGMKEQRCQIAILAEDVHFSPDLTCFLPVRLEFVASGQLRAIPVPTNTSGDFASLAGTDGYVELALEQEFFASGTAVPFRAW